MSGLEHSAVRADRLVASFTEIVELGACMLIALFFFFLLSLFLDSLDRGCQVLNEPDCNELRHSEWISTVRT